MATYVSKYSGSELDESVGVVLDSQVTSVELGVLHNVVKGSAVANKAVVLNDSKDIEGINVLSTSEIRLNNSVFDNYDIKPSSPAIGYYKVYFRNGVLTYQDSNGIETTVSAISKKEEPFTDTDSVTVTHNFGNQYPVYQVIGDNDEEIKGDVTYVDENNFKVEFTNIQSGMIKLYNL